MTLPKANNLFENLPSLSTGEDFSVLLNHKNVVIERIVSSRQPDTKIYNQIQDEWFILLTGKATLKVNEDIVNLQSGDYLFLPAYTPHQVLQTTSNCVWLAIHIY